MTKYTVMFNGHTFTRNSEHVYTHAAFNPNRRGNRAWVSFHGSEKAARRAAGSFGLVHAVISDNPTAKCIVCNGERYYTEQHADGSHHRVACWKCNR
jgi:hypothetical protein